MFCIIYRVYTQAGREQDFHHAWQQIARYFIEHCGALGSCLHKTQTGEWIAYSRWPDQATRDKYWLNGDALPDHIKATIQILKECFDTSQPYEEICMEMVEDLL